MGYERCGASSIAWRVWSFRFQMNDRNASFFNSWNEYPELVANLDSYRLFAKALEGEVSGRVLDVGNGGVVNYSLEQVSELVVLDVAEEAQKRLPNDPRITFKLGSALDLPLDSESFDLVLIQHLLHHLAGQSVTESAQRVKTALQEAARVLKPGGKLLIIESCLPQLSFKLEGCLFPVLKTLLTMLKHPIVLQWSCASIQELVGSCGFGVMETKELKQGKWILLLGRKWPTLISPLRQYRFVATKSRSSYT